EADLRSVTTPPSEANVPSPGGATIGIQISFDPVTEKFTFIPAPTGTLGADRMKLQSATYRQQLAEEHARGQKLERELAARQIERQEQERTRSGDLERRLAAGQSDQRALARERAQEAKARLEQPRQLP